MRAEQHELLRAVLSGNAERVKELLEGGYNPNMPFGSSGTAALHHAAGNGLVGIVELLLRYGADPSPRDADGGTPAHWAAVGGHADVLALLLKKGADVNACTARLNTPLHRAMYHGCVPAARLLLEQGANPDAKNADGSTPRDFARRKNRDGEINFELAALFEELAPRVSESDQSLSGRVQSARKSSKKRAR